MALLPGPNAGATCSYNGVNFVAGYKSSVSARPVLDEAKRTTVYVEHTLTVAGWVQATPDTNVTLAAMRKRLTATGGTLTYQNKGFGDLVVNAGRVRDVAWGPVPELLEWVPLGGDGNAARLTWRVVTRIPECDSANYQGQPLAYNYEVTYDIDQDGFTTIRTAGYLEIPMTRTAPGGRSLPDSADRYRETVRPDVPAGFHRQSQSFQLSKDKRRLDFTFSDVETPAPLPDYVTVCNARHRIEAPAPFQMWAITIEADITMARGQPKTDAFAVFLLVVESRVRRLLTRTDAGHGVFPKRYSFEDDIFGRSARFSIALSVVGFTISEILNLSGMWQPIAGTNYSRWQASLDAAGASSVRGWAGAANQPGNDTILDLCLGAGSTLGTIPDTTTGEDATLRAGAPSDPGGAILKGLTPDNSWWLYSANVEWSERANIATHKPLPQPLTSTLTTVTGLGAIRQKGATLTTKPVGTSALDEGFLLSTGAPGAADPNASYPPDVYQRTAAPSRVLVFSGTAARLGYRVPVPTIPSVGGVTPVEIGRWTNERAPTALGNIRMFGLAWRIVYSVPTPPQGPLPYTVDPVGDNPAGSGPVGPLQP